MKTLYGTAMAVFSRGFLPKVKRLSVTLKEKKNQFVLEKAMVFGKLPRLSELFNG